MHLPDPSCVLCLNIRNYPFHFILFIHRRPRWISSLDSLLENLPSGRGVDCWPLKVPSSLACSNLRRIPKTPCKGHRLRCAVTGRGLRQPDSQFFPACVLSDSPSTVTHGGEAEHATCLDAARMGDAVSPGPQATGMLTHRPGVQTAAHSALSASFIPVLHHQGSSLGSMTFLWKGP